MSGHTAGPWKTEDDGDLAIVPDDEANDSYIIAKLFGPDAAANARLVAAAPDLLAVLQDMPDIIKDFDGGNPETSTGWASEEMLDLWQRVRAAIAKAEGDKP